MVDNQHRRIKGYRELSQEEIGLMNRIKEKAAEVGELIDELDALAGIPGATNTVVAMDKRWLSIGRTDLQKGFMALTRSVAKPDFF